AAFGIAAVRVAGDFEQSMNRVAAVSGATGNELEQLSNIAKEMGRTTQFTASDAADALGFLAMAGFDAKESMEALPGTLQLAASAQMDLAESADIVSNVLSGYGMEVSDLARVNDVLVKAFTASNTNLQQLGEAMTYAGPVAAAAGVQFEEATAALGLMGNAGIQASMAGTSLRGAISRILAPTKKVSGIMAELGLKFTDAQGKLVPLVDIITQLGPHADDAGLFMELFGQRAGPAMAALVSQGAGALTDLTTDLQNAGGTAKRIADVQMEGLNGAMKRLQSAFEGLQIAIAESGLLDIVGNLVTRLSDLIQRMSEVSPTALRVGTAIAAIAAAAGPVLLVMGTLISSASTIVAAFATVGP
ncbi:MAG: phage tail tape measure protein, partial [Pseudomonadota bacterium]|nr:phage tail tape measure protein [Pseudomonadota bacterium]